MVLKITKALLKNAKKAMKTMQSMNACSDEDSVESLPFDELGVFVANLKGELLHVECHGGSACDIGYLDFWVRRTRPGLPPGSRCLFFYEGQLLDHRRQFRDYRIPDGSTVQVIIQ